MSRDTKERYQFSIIRERMRDHSGRVLNFALGDLQQKLPESIVTKVASDSELIMKRATPVDTQAFGAQASAYLSHEFGVVVEPEQILPVPSGRVAMTALTACLLAPGDVVLVTEPGYPAFARVAAHRHCRVRPVPLDPGRDFAPDLSNLGADQVAEIRFVALNYPNNPTGAVLTEHTIEALGDLDRGAILFNDATYGPLVYSGRAASLLGDGIGIDRERPVVELHSLGKLFDLGPLACAFLIGSADAVEELRRYSDFAWAPLSALHLQIATLALAQEGYIEEVRALYGRRTRRLRNILRELGFNPYPTPAGIYVLTRVPATIDDRQIDSAQQAADLLLDRHGLAVAAWDILPERYLRFSSLYSAADLAALVELKDSLRLSS